ncbi:MAG: hypothetical protein QNJ65_14230 [Xenococcaceae cyanobacterium MO_234.B1]|nr:hypothetical protein [Xenococcaceae cyanobacterium MO_234.B1]
MYQRLRSHEKYVEYTESDFGMFTINRNIYHGGKAQIFYDIDYFCQMVKSFFKIISVTKEAYGFQTAVLLQKGD